MVQPISIPVLGDNSQNVVAERLGTGSGTRDLVLVVAHLDSINISGGPEANAPVLTIVLREARVYLKSHECSKITPQNATYGLYSSEVKKRDCSAANSTSATSQRRIGRGFGPSSTWT